MSTKIKFAKDAKTPSEWYGDDGRINMYAFKSATEFQKLLKALGVTNTLISGGKVLAGGGAGAAKPIGTWLQAGALIAQFIYVKKYTLSYDNGVKKGHTGTLKFSANPALFVAIEQQMGAVLIQQDIKRNHTYNFNVKKKSGEMVGVLT